MAYQWSQSWVTRCTAGGRVLWVSAIISWAWLTGKLFPVMWTKIRKRSWSFRKETLMIWTKARSIPRSAMQSRQHPEKMTSGSKEEIFCLQEPLRLRKQLRIFFSRNGTSRIFWSVWMRRPRNVPDRQCWTSTLQEKLRSSVITHRRISWQQWKKVSFPWPATWIPHSWDSTVWKRLPIISKMEERILTIM